MQLFARPQSDAIQFEVTNRSDEIIQYTVGAATGNDDRSDRQTFELPPGATMFHARCLPPHIDWGWTGGDDGVKVASNGTYEITKSASGAFEVTEQPAIEKASLPGTAVPAHQNIE